MLKRPVAFALAAALAMVTAFVALALSTVPAAQAAAPVRVMPLGDSITGSPGCWRALLWNRLQSDGFVDVDMVGTLGPQGCGVPYDGDNEGHGGALVTNVADQNQLVGWLASARPDVVLMHFGTNDVWNNRPTATILAAYGKLVDQMRASNPSMRVLVAQIIPMNPSNCAACGQRVVDLNAAIPGWAASKSTTASPVIVVDQWTRFSTSADTTDGVHPDASGDQKLSDRWYPALASVLGGTTPSTPPVDNQPPTAPGQPTASNVTSFSATLSWPASSDDRGVTGYEVFRATGASGGTFTQVGTSTTTTFTGGGLSPVTTYRFQVRARDAAGNPSGFSPVLSVTTPTDQTPLPPPAPPAGPPSATGITCTGITLTWPASPTPGVTYQIERATGAAAVFTVVGTSTTTSFTDTTVAPLQSYRYQIRARDSNGVSNATTPLAVMMPNCPTSITTTTTTPPPGGCTAAYTPVGNPWPGGYQGQVRVTNTGTTTLANWRVTLTLSAGTVAQLWGGRTTQTASPYTVANEPYTGNLPPAGSATFGFIGAVSGSGGASVTVTCARA